MSRHEGGGGGREHIHQMTYVEEGPKMLPFLGLFAILQNLQKFLSLQWPTRKFEFDIPDLLRSLVTFFFIKNFNKENL
jgi:hypothetical protein